jgi:hypothetical protein
MLKRVFKRAFGAEVAAAAIAGPADEAADEAAAQRAWAAGDRAAFARAARTLRAAGSLPPVMALRLARTLLDAGLAGEALGLLEGEEGERLAMMADAQLRLGRAAEADAVLRAAAGHEAGMLERIVAARLGRSVPEAWPEASALVWAALELEQGDAAAGLLADFLRQGLEAERSAVLEAAVAAFRLAGPAAGRALEDALSGLAPADIHGRTCMAMARAAAGDWPGAIAGLEPTRKRSDLTSENLSELARCVGRDLLSGFELEFGPPRPPKVFNLLPFNTELTLLEMRLEEMGPWVDRFVIVEAGQTHTGRPKPLHFLQQQQRFARWVDKIVHVRAPEFPDHVTAAWARDFFQRDSAVLGLQGLAAPDDVVIITDADELIRREALDGLPASPLAGADLRTFGFFYNYEVVYGGPRIKAAIVRARLLASHGCSWLRLGATRYFGHTYVPNAGWHFTSIADPEALELKFQSTSHEEHGAKDKAYFERLLAKIRREGLGPPHVRRELDDSFPAALLRRREALADLIL